MEIREQLVRSTARVWPGTSRRTSITVHETANPAPGANAQAHANLQSRGNVRSASWHIQVDDRQAIRSYRDDQRCWHAGRRAQDSIAIEICVNRDGDYDRALANAAKVVRQLRAKYGLGRGAVFQHHGWTGKNCPAVLRASGRWHAFVASTDPGPRPVTPPQPEPETSWLEDMMATGERQLADIAAAIVRDARARERQADAQTALAAVEAARHVAQMRAQYGYDPDPHSDAVHGQRVAAGEVTLKDVGDRLKG